MMVAIAARSRRNTAALVLAGAGLLISLAPFVWRNHNLSDANIALAVALAWMALIPGILHLLRIDAEPMPFAALVGLYYLVFFALPVLFFDPAHWQADQYPDGNYYGLQATHFSDTAQVVLLAGLVSLLIAYYAARRGFDRLPFRMRLPRDFAAGRLRLLAWLLIATHFAWDFIPYLRALPSLGLFVQKATLIGFGILLVCLWRRQMPVIERILLLLGALPLFVAMVVASGLTTNLALLALYLTILMYHFGIRSAALPLFLCVALMTFLYPAMGTFRAIVWSGPGRSYSLAERIAMPIEMAWHHWIDMRRDSGDPMVPIVRRISIGAVTFSDVVERTPGEIPFLRGDSYRPLLTGIVPRLVWRDKPEERFGQRFGHRYRYITPDDQATSWSTPWITEAYANFGAAGTVVVMLLIGAFLGFASRLLNATEMSANELAIGAALLFPLAYQASNLSVMVSNLPTIVGAVWLFFWVGLRVGNGGRQRSRLHPA